MTPTITRILVPTDFSNASDAALEWAKVIARSADASLHLLHVFEEPYMAGPFSPEGYTMASATVQALRKDADIRLAHRLSADEKIEFEATTDVVIGIAASTIVDYARDHAIDLIVMGTHGRTGMAHLLIGSVAEHVVRIAPCPVLTVHHNRTVVKHADRSYLPEFPLEIPA